MRRKLHTHPVSGPNPDEIRGRRSNGMRQNQILILQLHPDGRVRKKIDDNRVHLHAAPRQGRVKTHGPFEVTATQCSK